MLTCYCYFSIAHTVHESVTEQASILVNGKLKEYQIKVIHLLPNIFKSKCSRIDV